MKSLLLASALVSILALAGCAIIVNGETPAAADEACSAQPGGNCYAGPGGPLYAGPGGPLYAGPGGAAYAGPGGACYAGPGGACNTLDGQGKCPAICSATAAAASSPKP